MADRCLTPLGAIARGAAAGAVGTLLMDLVWYARYRRGGGLQSFVDWEFSTATDSFEDAGAPAKVGQRLAAALFDADLPDRAAGTVNNVVHWATGVGYGAVHGLVSGSTRRPAAGHGLVTGPAAFATSYTLLPMMDVYEPLWEYDATTIYEDLSAHVVFGLGAALVFRSLTRGLRPRNSPVS